MADHPVTIQIPDYIYERAQRIAQQTAQPIEHVLASHLAESFNDVSELPPDERAELVALNSLSDDTLRTIAAERLPGFQQERLSLLLALNKRSVLSDAEEAELDHLLERGDRLTLRKAEAAVILMRRGHPISGEDFAAVRE